MAVKPTASPARANNPVMESIEKAARIVATEGVAATKAAPAPRPQDDPKPTPAMEEWSAKMVGQRVVQTPQEMYTERLGGTGVGSGGILTATRTPMTIWYHSDGTTSLLPTMLDWYYGAKPNFHPPKADGSPPDWWEAKQKFVVRCPVTKCGDPIRIVSEADQEALEALGFAAPLPEVEVRRAVLTHLKRYHPQTFGELLLNGTVTDEESKRL